MHPATACRGTLSFFEEEGSRLTRADSTPQVLEGRGLGVKRVMRGDLFVEFTGAHSGAPPGGAPGDARRFYHMSSKLGDDIAFWECFVTAEIPEHRNAPLSPGLHFVKARHRGDHRAIMYDTWKLCQAFMAADAYLEESDGNRHTGGDGRPGLTPGEGGGWRAGGG